MTQTVLSPGQVSSDSRSLLERLRRCQLWHVAEQAGLPYPEGAKKQEMIDILKAHQVDPRKYIRFEVVYGRNENGMPTQEQYPTAERHASAEKSIDYNSIIEARAKTKTEKEERKFEESRMEALERQNRELMEKLNSLMEQKAEPPASKLPYKLTLAQKKAVLRDKGYDTKGMSREDVEKHFAEE